MIQDRFRLDDQVAIVTGPVAASGPPRAVALAEAGADVVLCRRAPRSSSTPWPSRSRPSAGAPSWCPPTSATSTPSPASPRHRRAGARAASTSSSTTSAARCPARSSTRRRERLIREFSWNVATAHALTRAAVPIMLETGGGAVVGISSMMGRTAGRGFVAYGTAKAALSHWTRLAAQDLAPRIRVNAIAVGLDRDVRARDRPGRRRPAHDDGAGHAAEAHRRPRGDRGHGALPRLPRPAATSPARSSRSTAASSSPTSTWACLISDAEVGGPTPQLALAE